MTTVMLKFIHASFALVTSVTSSEANNVSVLQVWNLAHRLKPLS